jgi:hypothetical protein
MIGYSLIYDGIKYVTALKYSALDRVVAQIYACNRMTASHQNVHSSSFIIKTELRFMTIL